MDAAGPQRQFPQDGLTAVSLEPSTGPPSTAASLLGDEENKPLSTYHGASHDISEKPKHRRRKYDCRLWILVISVSLFAVIVTVAVLAGAKIGPFDGPHS